MIHQVQKKLIYASDVTQNTFGDNIKPKEIEMLVNAYKKFPIQTLGKYFSYY